MERFEEEFDRVVQLGEGPSCRPKERGRPAETAKQRQHRQNHSPPPSKPRRKRSPSGHPWVPSLPSKPPSPDRASPPRPRRRDGEEAQEHPRQARRVPQWEEGPPRAEPPRFRGKFDGDPDQVAQFLDAAEIYIERYRHLYPFPRALVSAIAEGLEGEARSWSAALYKNRAHQLQDADAFLQLLRTRFEEMGEDPYVEDELRTLKQRGRPIKEHIREFRRRIGTLPPLPERLLVYFFRTSLDTRIAQVTAYREIPNRLTDWFRVAMQVERGLRATNMLKRAEYQETHQPDPRPRTKPQPTALRPAQRPFVPRNPLKCYRCGGMGHLAATCSTPGPRPTPTPPPRPRPERRPRRTDNTPRKLLPGTEVFARLTEAKSAPEEGDQSPDSYDTDDDGEDDPMVSGPIRPFLFPICLTAPRTGAQGTFQALIDSGSTRCLINLPTVLKLGIRAKKLNHPIRFQQVDGTLLGGAYATHLTEPVKLELGDHWEVIRFIIAPKMTNPVILGLSWLDKWGPIIWWQEGTRRLRISLGPHPLPFQPEDMPPPLERQPLRDPTPKMPPSHISPSRNTVKQLTPAPNSTHETEQIPREYQDLAEVFSEAECDILPPHREADCAIEIIPGAKLPKPKLYPMTPREMQEMRDYIDKNLRRGFIEPTKPRVAAPVLFKEKKDGSMRLVVDFRGINAVCVRNLYPLPLMKDMLAHLARGKVFTKLDLREAYYRVRIREGDEWKTAFNCPLGSFQFKVMPFGLQGAPAVFMQLINEVLHEHLYKGVLVYLDDILIYTETIDEHIPLVRQVLEKLLKANLYVKLSKCEFHQSRLDYLGYRVSKEGIEMDPTKVLSVLNWQPPRTRRQLQSFLGFANFYRQFIPSFATIAKPLTDLLRTGSSTTKPRPGQPLQWSPTCQQAFEMLKEMFAKEPILKHPDPEQPFIIQADASDVAVGAVLLQKNDQGNLQPCAYTSRKLTDTERRWAAWEKEAFAVRWALLTWRHLLEGGQKPFEVWTDHKNLEALRTPRKLSPRQVRWAQYFNRFNFELKHIPGGKNFLADALSRMPQYNSERELVVNSIIPSGQSVGQVTTRRRRLDQHGQSPSDLTTKLKTETSADPWFRDNQHLLTKRDGLAWKGTKLYVPQTLRILILQRSHDAKSAGHFGFLKTLHLVRRQFWWPHMRKDVDSYVKSCTICATMKTRPGKPPGLLQPVAEPSRPWEEIAMDFIVELPSSGGNTVIWTVIDLFSKQAHFIPCSGLPSARQLAKLFVKHIYRLHGVPRRIISDRGVQFTAKFWREFLRSIGSSQGLSSAFHPATNGGAERLNAMIEQYLRCYVDYQQSNWADLLSFAEVAYNNAVHSSTGLTPFKIVTGMDFVPMPEYPREPPSSVTLTDWMTMLRQTWDNVKKALEKAAQSYKNQADKHREPQRPFRVGEKVYLSTKYLRLRLPTRKLGPKFIGPFPIVKIINPVTVQLKLPRLLGRIHPVFHSSLLKPVVGSTLRPVPRDPPGPLTIGGQTHYEVQRILDSRWHRGRLQYLIKWKGYPLSEASWVKSTNVQADRLIARFHADHPDKPGGGGMDPRGG